MAGENIDLAAAEALFTEQFSRNVIEKAAKRSTALAAFPNVPMSSATFRMPVLAALPSAGFLNADQDVKPLSEMSWDKKMLTAEEIAVIVPISETVIADATVDVVGKVEDRIGEAVAKTLDAAVFFGTGAPTSWPDGGLFDEAVDGTQTVEASGGAATTDLGDDLNALLALIEEWGGDPSDVFAARSLRTSLRGLRDTNGQFIYGSGVAGSGTPGSVYGLPLRFPLGWDKAKALAIAVDREAVMIGVRQDLTFTILREASLTGFGSLAEKDSIAIRAVARYGLAFANPVAVEDGARHYPVAALTPYVA